MKLAWLFRIIQILPWLGILWLLSLGVDGHASWFLVIILLIIFLPGAFLVTLVSTIGVRGASAWQQMQQPSAKPSPRSTHRSHKGRVKVTNMAESSSRHVKQ